jgi:hypothetical protein
MGATISVSDHTYLEEERHKGDPRRWTCHLNIQSLVETSGTIVNHICQEALGCKSLLMKEGKKQNIWKKMHCHLSKVGEMNLLSLATLNMNSCVV